MTTNLPQRITSAEEVASDDDDSFLPDDDEDELDGGTESAIR